MTDTPEVPQIQTTVVPLPTPVVGVDPPVSDPAAPPVEPQVPEQVTLTQEEFQALQDRAANYESIANNPQLATMINDHLRSALHQAPPPVQEQQQPQQNQQPDPNSEIAQLKQQLEQGQQMLQGMQQQMGAMRLDAFKQRNSDFAQHETAIASILQQAPQLGLDGAYTLAKARASQTAQPPSSESVSTPAAPITEGSGAGPAPSVTGIDGVVKSALDRINSRKATPHADNYIQEAFEAAQQIHANQ